MSDKTFTESLNTLKEAADQIGRPATSLEEALKLFDKGMEESEFLNSVLSSAEQKIEVYEKEKEKEAESVE